MPAQEISKSIEARKLNRRSRLPLPEPPVTIPFGSLVSDLEPQGDLIHFTYLGDLYQCQADLLNRALGHAAEAAGSSLDRTAATTQPLFDWQEIRSNKGTVLRAKVPHGWIIAVGQGLTFYPDTKHEWDGTTLS
jgi:hypothetical protein